MYVCTYIAHMILCIHDIYDGTHHQYGKIPLLNILLGEIYLQTLGWEINERTVQSACFGSAQTNTE